MLVKLSVVEQRYQAVLAVIRMVFRSCRWLGAPGYRAKPWLARRRTWSHALAVQPGRLLTRLAALGFAPDDTEEERLTKAVLTLSACLVGVLSFAWVFTYFAIGQPLAAAIPLAYQIVSLASLVVFSRTRRVRTFHASQLAMILVLPF